MLGNENDGMGDACIFGNNLRKRLKFAGVCSVREHRENMHRGEEISPEIVREDWSIESAT